MTKEAPCSRWVSPRTIQDKLDVREPKTIRAWAKKLGWRTRKINARVFRYCAEDVEKTLEVDLT